MFYDLSNIEDTSKFNFRVEYCIQNKKKVQLSVPKLTRSKLQNRSLHLYFTFISEQLNELGLEFQYFGLKNQQLSMRYTDEIVKEFFWRPIQRTLFNIESTTDLDTYQMNQIIDVITKFFADKGVNIPFPCLED